MLSYASAYKMCVPTLSKLLNATARSRRAGPRACRLPDQLAWETLPGSAREGVSSYKGEARAAAITALPESNPQLWLNYRNDLRDVEAFNNFSRISERYPL